MAAVVLLEHFGQWLPEETYIKLLFRLKMGYSLNLNNPNSFCEKLQWLKLHDHNDFYTTMVDKYAVKDYVARIIGNEYIIPTLGVWNSPEEIDWDVLPNRFVLKTTHGGGSSGVIICNDKKSLNKKTVMDRLRVSMRQNIYKYYKEWPYKNVIPRIIAEEYIESSCKEKGLSDYKWYCFNGEPKFCQVIQDRRDNETIDFFDVEWQHQEFVGLNPMCGPAAVCPSRPVSLETQLFIARKLSKGLPFVRIDLYAVRNRVFFGEITFYPASGFGAFSPTQYNEILGQMILL